MAVCESQRDRDVTSAPTSTTSTPGVTVTLMGFTPTASTVTIITSLAGVHTTASGNTPTLSTTGSVADVISQGASGGDEGDFSSGGTIVAIVIFMLLLLLTFVAVMIKRQRRQRATLPEFEKQHDSRMFSNPMLSEEITLNSFDTQEREPNQRVPLHTDVDIDPSSPTISETSFIVPAHSECQLSLWDEENERNAITRVEACGRERAKSIHLAEPVYRVSPAALQPQLSPDVANAGYVDAEHLSKCLLWSGPSDADDYIDVSHLARVPPDADHLLWSGPSDADDYIDASHLARAPPNEEASVMLAGKEPIFAGAAISVQLEHNDGNIDAEPHFLNAPPSAPSGAPILRSVTVWDKLDGLAIDDGCTACNAPIESGPRENVNVSALNLGTPAATTPAIKIDTLELPTPILVLDMGSATPTLILGTDATASGGQKDARWTEVRSESESDDKHAGGTAGNLGPEEFRDRSSSVC